MATIDQIHNTVGLIVVLGFIGGFALFVALLFLHLKLDGLDLQIQQFREWNDLRHERHDRHHNDTSAANLRELLFRR
jgi:hypothetical protein